MSSCKEHHYRSGFLEFLNRPKCSNIKRNLVDVRGSVARVADQADLDEVSLIL